MSRMAGLEQVSPSRIQGWMRGHIEFSRTLPVTFDDVGRQRRNKFVGDVDRWPANDGLGANDRRRERRHLARRGSACSAINEPLTDKLDHPPVLLFGEIQQLIPTLIECYRDVPDSGTFTMFWFLCAHGFVTRLETWKRFNFRSKMICSNLHDIFSMIALLWKWRKKVTSEGDLLDRFNRLLLRLDRPIDLFSWLA